MPVQRRLWDADRLLAALLFVGIVAYLWYLPRNLGRADESYFLYEAKRIRDGEVMYRDFFQFVTPLSSYVMALCFVLFGTTIGTARTVMAVLHGLTGIVLYAAARSLDVRRPLAVVPALAYVAICYTAWHFASWHWFSTFLTALAMLAMLRVPWASRPRSAIIPGLITGLLIGTQQQKGAMIAAGVGAIFALDYLVSQRYAVPDSWRALLTRLVYFSVGIALVVVPLLAIFLALAGGGPMYDALVRFPLVNYRGSFRTRWGAVLSITAGYAEQTYPLILKYLPLALLPAGARIAIGWYVRADRAALRRWIVLVCSSASAALSIWYLPDFIHIAFVAGIFMVAAAEAMEWALRAFVAPERRVVLGWVIAAALILALAAHLRSHTTSMWNQYQYPHDTAFGRVDYDVAWAPVLVDRTRQLLSEARSNELWAYNTSEPYLTMGARNPTPYQFFYAKVSPPEHAERVVEILSTQRVPFIMSQSFFLHPEDPIVQAILRDYESVEIPELKGLGFRNLSLYRRKELHGTGDYTPPRS